MDSNIIRAERTGVESSSFAISLFPKVEKRPRSCQRSGSTANNLSFERLSTRMAKGCHDRQLVSSLAFGRGWNRHRMLLCVRDFAAQKDAAFCSAFAAAVTAGSSTAAIGAGSRRAGNNAAPQTFVISRARKEGWIIEIASAPTGAVEPGLA